ncbi:MAG: ABC transporter permease [bacterium]|nr:ABC transporter permease [bacterium]
MLFRLAWRNLWRRKRRTAITAISVALGIALCMFFTGLSDGIYGKIIAMATRLGSGHLVIENPEYRDDQDLDHTVEVTEALLSLVRRQPEVTGYSLRVTGPAIVSSSHGTVASEFDAINPELDEEVSLLAKRITEGRYLESAGEMIVGSEVARKLKTRIGGKVVLTTQDRDGETVQELYRVAGIFKTRSAMLDGFYVQITLDKAQEMLGLGPGEVTQLGIYLTSDRKMDRVVGALERSGELEPIGAVVVPWQEVLKDLADYMKVDIAINYVFQVLLFLVILAGVLNTVLMSVMERTYEFGVLLSIGMKRAKLMVMVVIECALLGFLGTGLGAVLGWLENAWLYRYPIDISGSLSESSVGGFFMEPSLLMDITLFHFAFTLAAVFVLILAVGAYPAWKAGQVEPVEALHTV